MTYMAAAGCWTSEKEYVQGLSQKMHTAVEEEEFWEDLDMSVSLLVQEALRGQDITRVAQRLKKSESLLYKWANPGLEQTPSLKQFLAMLRITRNYEPLARIARACGFGLVPVHDPAAAIRALAEVFNGK